MLTSGNPLYKSNQALLVSAGTSSTAEVAMKLFYAPGACSLSPHIVAREAGLELQLEKVDFSSRTVGNGAAYGSINPKGYLPALQLDDGELLTEGPAIVQYLADCSPDAGLAP